VLANAHLIAELKGTIHWQTAVWAMWRTNYYPSFWQWWEIFKMFDRSRM